MSIFTGLLASIEKIGGIERPDQQQMELDFSQMAAQFVIDRAPALTPYALGFEIVERDDDGTHVCGVFGYKIGAEFYMIPAFFINGQIKGLNSIYSKSTNMFSPLTEGVIDKLISRSTVELGKGVDRGSVQRDLLMPSFDNFRSLGGGDGGNKYASEMKQMWNSAASITMSMLENDPSFQNEVGAALIKKAGMGDLDVMAGDSPLISYLKATGPTSTLSFLNAVGSDAKLASAVVDMYGSVDPFKIEAYDTDCIERKPKPKPDGKKVTIVYSSGSNLSGADKKRLVRDGFRIVDKREPTEKSDLYDIEFVKSYSNHDAPGKYNLLLSSGVTTEAWVLRPFNIDSRGLTACVETDKHCLAMADPSLVYTRSLGVEGDTAYDSGVDIQNMKLKGRYMLVNKKGNYLGPFTVSSVCNDPNERLRVAIQWPWYARAKDTKYPEFRSCAEHRNIIELVPGQRGDPRLSGDNIIVVPEADMRALELNYPTDAEACGYNDAEKDAFRPGSPADVYDALFQEGFRNVSVIQDPSLTGTCRLKVDGVLSHPVSYKSAFVTLVGNYGYHVEDADEAVTEMDVKGMSSRLALVKLAQESGVNMPWVQLPEFTGADPYSGAMTQGPQSAVMTGNEPNVLPPQRPFTPGMADGTAYTPGPPQPDQEALQVAMQAAQSGQRTVFDHAGIASLAKLYDVNTVLDSYVPEMTKALDRIGRILFLFQWKSDEFVDRFGADSLPDMEDQLGSVYKSFGDLVLKLREKAINPDQSSSVNM